VGNTDLGSKVVEASGDRRSEWWEGRNAALQRRPDGSIYGSMYNGLANSWAYF
jgi:hypothetical protein